MFHTPEDNVPVGFLTSCNENIFQIKGAFVFIMYIFLEANIHSDSLATRLCNIWSYFVIVVLPLSVGPGLEVLPYHFLLLVLPLFL